MRIDLYGTCWNEERMIPFFLRHYEPIADRIVIFDDGSSDRSIELWQQSAKVELRQLEQGESSNVTTLMEMNRCWKESRGHADWVIIADIDEFIYHPRLRDYLAECTTNAFTILQPIGIDMISADFPNRDSDLTKTVRRGVPLRFMDKPAIFDPNAIEEMNYEVGRHEASPLGRVVFPPTRQVKLLHYKHLGAEYLVARTKQLRGRKTQLDRDRAWGVHLERSPEELQTSLAILLERAREVI
jgi:glycosyltransferase involved in cell wall biosynthesis